MTEATTFPTTSEKLWTHSADSHFLEPKDHWHQFLPTALAERMPRVELIGDNEERVHVDGKSFVRAIPNAHARHHRAELPHRQLHNRRADAARRTDDKHPLP